MSANRLPFNFSANDAGQTGQMHIDESDLARRKRLFGIDSTVCRQMALARVLVTEDPSSALNTLYPFPSDMTAGQVPAGVTLHRQRALGGRRRYLTSLFSGEYDAAYVSSRLRIGYRYARMDINMAVYLSGMRQLAEVLRRMVPTHTQSALDKLLAFDNALILEAWTFVTTERMKMDLMRAEGEMSTMRERCSHLEQQVRQDPLTQLLNVRSLQEILTQESRRVHRTRQPLCVLYIDIDDFKRINDTYGHGVGDEVLRATARVLRSQTRTTDYVFRCGGDEFCVVAIDTVLSDAERLAAKLADALQLADTGIACSIGIAQLLPGHEISIEQLIAEADSRMYACKLAHDTVPSGHDELKAG